MKLLVSDFDNTLYNEDYLENISLINNFVAKGNTFAIATGRSLFYLKEGISNHKIPYNYLICSDGSVIYDSNYNTVMEHVIDEAIVLKVYEKLKTYSSIKEVLIVNEKGFYDNPHIKALSVVGKFVNREEALKIIEELCKEIPGIQGYTSTNWINIIGISESKGNAIKYLQEHLNIKKEDIYTIGDAINDLSMNSKFNGYALNSNCQELIAASKGTLTSFKEIFEVINESNNN